MSSAGFGVPNGSGGYAFLVDQDGNTTVGDEASDVFQLTGSAYIAGPLVINDASADVDLRVESNNNENMLVVDAGNDRVGIGTGTPSTTLDVDGTIKGDYYITTPSTQDLGSGTSSTLSIGSGLMFLDADSITGQDLGIGMDVHTLNIPNGTTSGQKLTLVIEGNMGAGNSVGIMVAGNLAGASDMFMPSAKTSLNFVYYSTASISAWYQV